MLKHAILIAVCLALSVSCAKNKEGATMNSVNHMQASCFGEHQFDIPHGFTFSNTGSSVTFYYGRDADFTMVEFQVIQEKVAPEEFVDVIAERASDIAAEINEEEDGPMLVAHEKLGEDTILLRYFRDDLSSSSHIHEVHRLVDGTQVLLTANSYKGKIRAVEDRLVQLAKRVSMIQGDNAGPGFCLGSVVVDSQSDYQMAKIYYFDRSPGHRDVALEVTVNTMSADENEPHLLNRLGGNLLSFGLSPRVLKKGATSLAGMPAEQWLGRYNEDKLVEHLFVIESFPENPSPQTPGLQIDLQTGGVPRSPVGYGLRPYIDAANDGGGDEKPVTSSLNDQEAVALWEAVTASVRHR